MYGVKEVCRQWHLPSDGYLKQLNFLPPFAEPALYVWKSTSELIFLLSYVDDLIITGNSDDQIGNVAREIMDKFDVK